MSSAKSRNFRRRAGDEGGDDDSTFVTPIPTNKPSTTKPKKTSSQRPPSKTLLSFADEEDGSPFSRPPPPKSSAPSSSSSRFSKSSSAHKLTSSRDRISPLPTSSSVPSNVQPQAGLYTKEALLELQKNTRTLAAPTRNKPKPPEPEPVVVLKGLIKPVVISNELDSGTNLGEDEMDVDRNLKDSGAAEDDPSSGLRDDDKEGMPDQATIEAIKAKRERLRQAKAAAPDYIALDGGSNHGEAEGLSDEEPEFMGRIQFFGEKVGGHDKKGVFDNFEEMAVSKERGVKVVVSDEEDDEDKMWEEEQVRKGLGKRLDDSVGNQGGGVSVSSVMHPPEKHVDGVGSYDGTDGTGDMFSKDVMSISEQAEIAMKAMSQNMKRVQESHGRTMMSVAKTEENLSSSLLNVTSLENSFSAACEKLMFMQELQHFVSVICDFLQDKAPFIEELEEEMQRHHEKRARAITERRDADNEDEISEIEQSIIVAHAELSKGGASVEKVASAVAASANARAVKSAPVELDEFGRDLKLQRSVNITRRAKSRERRRSKADSKRKSAMETDSSVQQVEGELSTDESDSESTAYDSNHGQLLEVADKIFSDAVDEVSQFPDVVERFETWKKDYGSSYRDAYMSLSIPAVFSPYVRLELLKWDPLHTDADFDDMKWHSLLLDYGLPKDENEANGDADADDADANLIPVLVEKIAIPILHHQLAHCWDVLSTHQTGCAVKAVNLIIGYFDHPSSALGELITVLRDRLTKAVSDLIVPTWSPMEIKAVPNAGRVAAYRFGTCVRLMRNVCMWNKILAAPVVEKIAVDELLCGKVLPHLRSIHSNVHDAIVRTERVIASMNGIVTADQSRKMKPLVDYLLLIGKTIEKRHFSSSAIHAETGALVRRLTKMLVELNEYDHARALYQVFNIKEAL